MKALFAITALAALAGPVYADCTYPPPPAKLPDGNSATMEEMLEGKKAVTQYITKRLVEYRGSDDPYR